MKSLIVYGPKGCGKTTHAQELLSRHGLCKVVEVESEKRKRNLRPEAKGVLYLTCYAETAHLDGQRFGIRVMSFEDAMRTISEPEGVEFTGVKPAYKVDWSTIDQAYINSLQKPHDRGLYEQQFQLQPSPTFLAFDQFVGAMARKLEKHRMEKGDGWRNASIEALQGLLAAELAKANMDPVDVANYAMMVWAHGMAGTEGGRQVQFNPALAAPYGRTFKVDVCPECLGGLVHEEGCPRAVDLYKNVADGVLHKTGPGLAVATGRELDYYGRKIGLPRSVDREHEGVETDDSYRERIQREEISLGAKINAGCDKAMKGWRCTRAYGHTGPCAMKQL